MSGSSKRHALAKYGIGDERVRVEAHEPGVDQARGAEAHRVGRVPRVERLRVVRDHDLEGPARRPGPGRAAHAAAAKARRTGPEEPATRAFHGRTKRARSGCANAVRLLGHTCGVGGRRSARLVRRAAGDAFALRGAVVLVLACARPSERLPALDSAARAIASSRALEGAQLGIAVLDVDSGRMLAAVGEHAPLNPASNAKLYTAGAALATLHGEHRYETTLDGKLEGDAVVGPLAIRGYGDPSLSTPDLAAMVEELRTLGVHRVDGDVVVDQRFFDEQTTPPAFEQQPTEWAGFRAPVSAVALDENCVTMTVRPSGRALPRASSSIRPVSSTWTAPCERRRAAPTRWSSRSRATDRG